MLYEKPTIRTYIDQTRKTATCDANGSLAVGTHAGVYELCKAGNGGSDVMRGCVATGDGNDYSAAYCTYGNFPTLSPGCGAGAVYDDMPSDTYWPDCYDFGISASADGCMTGVNVIGGCVQGPTLLTR